MRTQADTNSPYNVSVAPGERGGRAGGADTIGDLTEKQLESQRRARDCGSSEYWVDKITQDATCTSKGGGSKIEGERGGGGGKTERKRFHAMPIERATPLAGGNRLCGTS